MRKKGQINIEISFPTIGISGNEFWVIQHRDDFTICNNKFLKEFNESKTKLNFLDSTGGYYRCSKIEKIGYTNILWGFNLVTMGSTFFANIYLEKNEELSIDELKKMGISILNFQKEYFSGTTLDIRKWKLEFLALKDKEDILRFLFYFGDPGRYNDPDTKDLQWRERIGILKKII